MTRLSASDPGPAVLERVTSGVYRLHGAPLPDHPELRAAWLQLAPEVPAWRRTAAQGTVSHRSAASLYGLGHLPADRHEFTLDSRRQSRRPDVRLHIRRLQDDDRAELTGLPVTRPSRTAADLLADGEDPGAVAQVIADAIGQRIEQPAAFAGTLAPYATRFGLRRGEGLELLAWLLETVAAPEAARWLRDARAHVGHSSGPAAPGRVVVPTPTVARGIT
jgi:predicted transcriptional regulator of viral defense system